MERIVITIARQYGSGGKTIGYRLARELGIRAYDREILRLASEDSGINESLFNQVDEKLGSRIFKRFMKREYKGELIPPENEAFLSDQNLFNYQAKIIKKLADEESCVIIGRCADFILKDNPHAVRTFIYASPEYNRKQVIERGARTGNDVDKYIQGVDKHRSDFYSYYTGGHQWTDARNYDICLNSEKLGDEGCVEAIKGYIRLRFGEDALD